MGTLDRICAFLGVRTGMVGAAPAENLSTWVSDSPLNRALQLTIRAGAAAGSYVPPNIWRQASRPLLAALHRRHAVRPKLAVEVRAQLLPRVAPDVALLESVTGESFQDWLSEQGRGAYALRKSPPRPA